MGSRSALASVLAVAVAASLAVFGAAAADIPFTSPGSVNLLRRVDQAGNLPTVTGSKYPGVAHDPIHVIDGGMQPWRVTGHGGTEWVQIELPEPVTMDTLDVLWRGSFYATAYTISGSTTGFGSMTTLVSVTGNTNAHPVHSIAPTLVQYLELQATGFADATYYITYELAAYNTAGPVIQERGYNLFAEPGKAGTITADMRRNLSDNPANAVDNSINTYVRATNSGGGNAWFVVPLTQPTELTALGLGMWEDQPWSGAQVYLSNDSSYNYLLDGGTDTWPGMTWTQVFNFAGSFNGAHIPLGSPQAASFIRVQWPNTTTAALCELQVFAWPEPGMLSLLALAGGGLLARRRRG
jgi:hypothetical protein